MRLVFDWRRALQNQLFATPAHVLRIAIRLVDSYKVTRR
jgi:hypothetical protein